jgi:hypothetical protein
LILRASATRVTRGSSAASSSVLVPSYAATPASQNSERPTLKSTQRRLTRAAVVDDSQLSPNIMGQIASIAGAAENAHFVDIDTRTATWE